MLTAHGLDFAGGAPIFGGWTEYWGYSAMRSLLDRSVQVDAVMCGSDQVARGVLDALRERGRAVPNEVAVIGFDNWGPILAGARPPLSTVDMSLEQLGRLAAKRLFDRIDGDATCGVQRLPCRLVLHVIQAGSSSVNAEQGRTGRHEVRPSWGPVRARSRRRGRRRPGRGGRGRPRFQVRGRRRRRA